MMLLQAGQLGLYRRDSIWTSEVPPEMVAGATLWLDFTDESVLFKGNSLDGGTPADGDLVKSVADKVSPGAGMAWIASTAPTLKAPAVNGQSVASLYLPSSTQLQLLSAFPDTAMDITALVTPSVKLIVAALKVNAAAPYTSNPWQADAVLFDAGGYMGLHLMDGSEPSSIRAVAYNYTASGTTVAEVAIPKSQWQIVTMSHQGGALRCRANGGAWVSTPSANTSVLGGNVQILGAAASGALDIEFAHLAVVKTTQTDAAISAVEHWLANDVGITPWW